MPDDALGGLAAEIAAMAACHWMGSVAAISRAGVAVAGLDGAASLGDLVRIEPGGAPPVTGEIVRLDAEAAWVLPDAPLDRVAMGDPVRLLDHPMIAPADGWIGRIVDPYGQPLDGRPLYRGAEARPYRAAPPPAALRRPLGPRLETGLAVFNTLLPIVRGQRLGLFAGSGVGKSMLLADLARGMQADVVVLGLVGERGRELRAFTEEVLGKAGMARSVVVWPNISATAGCTCCCWSIRSPALPRRIARSRWPGGRPHPCAAIRHRPRT